MKILITAPSLDTKYNVSGISSVVNNIFATTELDYVHFEVGKQDKEKRDLKWVLKQLFLPLKLFNVFLTNKIDLFHLNAPLNPLSIYRDFVLLLVAKFFRKKTILHFHGGKFLVSIPENKWFYLFLRFYFSMGNKIIALSEYERTLVSQNYQIPLDKIVSLENSVIPLENIIKEKNNKPRIIFLGRIVESKGINEIIVAMKKLYDRRKDFEFYLYGTGPLEEKIIHELSTFMPQCFHYKGVVSGEAKDNAMIEADIFLLPSLYGEGLPIALLEAMNTENIAIVTEDGSMGSVISNDINGLIVAKSDVDGLCDTLERAIELVNRKDTRLQQAAKNLIMTRYNSKLYSQKLNEIYGDMIGA